MSCNRARTGPPSRMSARRSRRPRSRDRCRAAGPINSGCGPSTPPATYPDGRRPRPWSPPSTRRRAPGSCTAERGHDRRAGVSRRRHAVLVAARCDRDVHVHRSVVRMGCGERSNIADVYVNGTLVKTVSLYASATSTKQVVFTKSWSSAAKRTIVIKVRGTSGHPRVDIDGLQILN